MHELVLRPLCLIVGTWGGALAAIAKIDVFDRSVLFGAAGTAIIAVLLVLLVVATRKAATAEAYKAASTAWQAETEAVRRRADRLHNELEIVLDQLRREHSENQDALQRIEELINQVNEAT